MTFQPIGEKLSEWKELEESIIACRLCSRLVEWREYVARQRRRAFRNEEYWGKAVPGFGDHGARILIVGLAPGAHGANRTGRMFCGDGSGEFLYNALHRFGFANQPNCTHREDSIEVFDVFISAICRCVPPANKPTRQEIIQCLPYLQREIALLDNVKVVVALGRIAFENTLYLYRLLDKAIPNFEFRHGAVYKLGERLPWLIASYHPSRQNTQTKRLTSNMFNEIWEKAKNLCAQ
jgi:uracil-DNA glycosylase family 4